MYDSPIEIFARNVSVEVENQVMKAVGKVGIHVNKEELLKALNYDRKQYDKGYRDAMHKAKQPRPLKYEEIKAGMYIWDNELKQSAKVERTFTQLDDDEQPFNVIASRWMDLRDGFFRSAITFEENRFYPIIIPKVMEE